MTDKVLFVDDEQGVLDGFERLLHKVFNICVALGGQQGLNAIKNHGPFAVVVSDMRMPNMNGAEFLAEVRQIAPESVRMLLTGDTDLNSAIAAVNEGNIYRFLTKPCDKDTLINAIEIGLEHYHSIINDKILVKKAQLFERSTAEETADICQWDNYEGPTGLPGPTQAKTLLAPLFGVDLNCYIVMYKISQLLTIEQRYGEEAAGDYLNFAAQFLIQTLRADDRLFHWDRDVLMAVCRRQLSPTSMNIQVERQIAGVQEHVMNVNGKSIMISCPMAFNLLPASQIASLDEMRTVFKAKSI